MKTHKTIRIHMFGPGRRSDLMREYDLAGLETASDEKKAKILTDMINVVSEEYEDVF